MSNPTRLINTYPQYFMLAVILLIGLSGMPLSTWVTLTVAGLGMGLMIFVMASGMTLTFGLMDVLNLGHGALITVGAFFGATLITGFESGLWPMKLLASLHAQPSLQTRWNIGAISASLILILLVSGLLTWGVLRVADSKLRSADKGMQLLVMLLGNVSAAGILWLFGGSIVSGSITDKLVIVLTAFVSGLVVAWFVKLYRVWKKRLPVYKSATKEMLLILTGAGVAVATLFILHYWVWSHDFVADMGILVPAFSIAFIGVGIIGYIFERLIIKPVYGDPLKQILVTVGAAYIIGELLKAFWGPNQIPVTQPATLSGGLTLGSVTIEKFRLLAGIVGLAIYWLLNLIIDKTKVGLLIRAGVENSEMVEALGYRIKLLFIMVFIGGAALAGIGGVMWGLYQGGVGVGLGAQMLVLIIIVIIIGGMGSIAGCFYGALMVGLLNNYTVYMFPKIALFSSILLMVIVLMWRPQGLKPIVK